MCICVIRENLKLRTELSNSMKQVDSRDTSIRESQEENDQQTQLMIDAERDFQLVWLKDAKFVYMWVLYLSHSGYMEGILGAYVSE